ncbi:MAG: YHS domain protein [Bacteroidetes bacterium]|nr:YHS domain protein [Bacteroidota bacterium]
MYKLLTSTLLLLTLFSTNVQSQNNAQKRAEECNVSNAVGIQGYDPVSFLIQGEGGKGKKETVATTEGVTYYFSSTTNKEAFVKNPSYYEPQYGGWCAYAMGNSGEKVEVDPETFKIKDGKLFLFYNFYFNNTLKSWNKDETNLKSKADANWKNIYK